MQSKLTALVFAVGKENQRLSPYFAMQFVVRGKEYGVVQQRALGVADRHRSLPDARKASNGASAVDLCSLHSLTDVVLRVREVLQQIDVYIEADKKSFVLFAQQPLQELRADFLLNRKHTILAEAGVEQDANGKRQVRFGFEVLDVLGLAVFYYLEFISVQVWKQVAAFVFHVE